MNRPSLEQAVRDALASHDASNTPARELAYWLDKWTARYSHGELVAALDNVRRDLDAMGEDAQAPASLDHVHPTFAAILKPFVDLTRS